MNRLALLCSALLATTAATSVALAETQVGVTAAVNPQATAGNLGKVRRLVLGDRVIFREKIDTSGEGLVQVLFVDGSTITVGPNASLLIDEYVYDPGSGTGKLTATVGKGALRFIGGKISKNREAVKINTVIGTVGIRGGMADLIMTTRKFLFLLLYGKEMTFTDSSGKFDRIYKQGYAFDIGPDGKLIEIRRIVSGDVTFMLQQLAGKKGTSGGAKKKPTEQQLMEALANYQRSVNQNRPNELPGNNPGDLNDDAKEIVQDRLRDLIDQYCGSSYYACGGEGYWYDD